MYIAPSHPGQLFFPFVTKLEEKVSQEAWIKKVSKTILIGGAKRAKNQLDYSFPLFENFIEEAAEIAHIIHGFKEEEKCSFDWQNDQEIIELHFILLSNSLQNLRTTKSNKLKMDILNWIYEPDVPDSVMKEVDGVMEEILIPFTFATCCRLEGANPVNMREELSVFRK